ncbi:hypothetical protein GS507_24385, partial [Rhodococcus hoagii]|nr:hypothetical protein [Prescottella equi]
RSWGYEVVPQVGVAGYRIDMAVRHPDKPGSYAIGIECDGAAYHSSRTARDRDRLREAVLRNLGWEIHRIWGLSWWREREVQEKRLRAAIEEAIAADGSVPTLVVDRTVSVPEVQVVDVDFDSKPDWVTDYRRYRDYGGLVRDVKTAEGKRDLRSFFTKAIQAEARSTRKFSSNGSRTSGASSGCAPRRGRLRRTSCGPWKSTGVPCRPATTTCAVSPASHAPTFGFPFADCRPASSSTSRSRNSISQSRTSFRTRTPSTSTCLPSRS